MARGAAGGRHVEPGLGRAVLSGVDVSPFTGARLLEVLEERRPAAYRRRVELELERCRVEAPPGLETARRLVELERELERLRFLERCQRVDERELERRRGAS